MTMLLWAACVALAIACCIRAVFRIFTADCDLRTLMATVNASKFRGKVVWITGASSGIGAALAKALAKHGALLILTSRDEEKLTQLAKSLPCSPHHIHVLPLDLTASSEVLESVAHSVSTIFGRLDYLFNNAGVSTRASALALDVDHTATVMSLNFFAPITLARACAPALNANPGFPGTIVNIVSIAAIMPLPLRSSYSASKCALAAYFNVFQLEQQLQARPTVSTLNIYPGSVHTAISENAIVQGGKRFGQMDPAIKLGLQPDRVADRILAAVSNGIADAVIAKPSELFRTRFYAWTNRRVEDLLPNFVSALGK